MIETMIVATVIAVLTAIAVPTIGRGLQLYRLGSAATDVANILERTRYEAIHRNTIVSCRYVQQGTRWLFWIDLNGNGKADPTEPQVLLPSEARILPAGIAPSPDSMGYTNTQIPAGSIAFDSRGTVNYGANPPAVYTIYIGRPLLEATNGYKAVTLTPTGRTKVWSASAYGAWYTN